MIFYHGTTQEGWDFVQQQGFLIYPRATEQNPNISPVVYLATNIEEAKKHGEIVLKVDYDPTINPGKNNYNPHCWQLRVYEPIDLLKIKKLL